MAAFVRTGFIERYVARDKRDDTKRIKDALEGGSVGLAALSALYTIPDFVVEGTTDSNTAPASSLALNLSDERVSFPANTYRDIRVEVWAANGSNCYRFRTIQRVLGGETPALRGPEDYETGCDAFYGFTTLDGTSTTEDAAACVGPAWWDGGNPVAGDVAANLITIQWLGANSPCRVLFPGSVCAFDVAAAAADARIYQHGNVNLANGTSDVFVTDAATPAAANWPSRSVVRVRAWLMPPVQAPVLVDAGKVVIGAQGLPGDLVTWRIRVFIGEPISLPLL